ncbi:hypothetical protein V8E55_011809 [Tylopilus felleus]
MANTDMLHNGDNVPCAPNSDGLQLGSIVDRPEDLDSACISMGTIARIHTRIRTRDVSTPVATGTDLNVREKVRVQEVTAEHAQLVIPSLGKGTQGRGPRMCESEGCVVLFKSSSRDQDEGEGCVLKRTQMLVVLSAPQLEVVCDLKVVVYDSLSRSLDIRICIGWPKRRVPALQAILGAAMDVALRNYTKVAKFEYRIINVWVLWVVVSLPEYYWRSMTRRTLLLTGCHSRGDRVPEHGELGKTFSADAQRHHGERHGGSGDVWASDVGCRKEERHLGAVGGRKLARLLLEQREELVSCRVVTIEGIGHWAHQQHCKKSGLTGLYWIDWSQLIQ